MPGIPERRRASPFLRLNHKAVVKTKMGAKACSKACQAGTRFVDFCHPMRYDLKERLAYRKGHAATRLAYKGNQ